MTNKENSKEDWEITNTRFVAFLDIMGFKDFVYRHTHEYVYGIMEKLSASKETLDNVFKEEGDNKDLIYSTTFSDSFILFSKNDSQEALKALAVSASFIVSEAIKASIPIKGAIAHGQMSVNKEQQIYFGQPLIDAYLIQEEVAYYGVILHNSVDKYLSSIKPEKRILEELIEFKTPMKTGNIQHNNLNWFDVLKDFKEKDVAFEKTFHDAMSKLKTLTSGTPRKYIDNTIDVFNKFYPK